MDLTGPSRSETVDLQTLRQILEGNINTPSAAQPVAATASKSTCFMSRLPTSTGSTNYKDNDVDLLCINSGRPTLTFVESKKGGRILFRAGRRYRRNKKNIDGSSIWICTSVNCKSSLSLNGTEDMVIRERQHSCLPDFQGEQVSIAIDKCRKRVRVESIPIPNIYEQETKQLKTEEFVDEVPSFNSVKSQLYMARNKYLNVSKASNFKNLADVEISYSNQKDFLLFDEGQSERILCFVSLKAREVLKMVKFYLLDGTFDSTPPPFRQIYTMHGDLSNGTQKNQVVPMVFALLPNKTQITYRRLFRLLKEAIPEFSPESFKIDFETAAINAIQEIFPNAKVSGCSFHFSKALWKKAGEVKLTDVPGGRKFLRMCTSMVHLPVPCIPEAWLHLMHNCPDGEAVTAFQGYMTNQWMSDKVALISCHGQIHKTTNTVEGWHNRLNRKVSKCLSMHNVIEVLKSESREADFKIYQFESHIITQKTSKKVLEKHQRIELIVKDYLENQLNVGDCLYRLSNIKLEIELKK